MNQDPGTAALLRTALQEKAATMFREPAGLLKHPFVDPGGPYGNNLWDWDSFWCLKTAAAMPGADDPSLWRARVLRHGSGVLDNWFEHQGEDGSLPILMTPDDVDWFDSTRNKDQNMAKPVVGQLAEIMDSLTAPAEDIARWLRGLGRFYACYEQRYKDPCGLYVWANDIAIGSDDDPTAWGRPPFSSGNLLLNCLLLADLAAASRLAVKHGQADLAATWRREHDATAEAIRTYCWDERDGFFYSVDTQCRQRTQPHRIFGTLNANLKPHWQVLPLKILYWTGWMPLWTGLASPAQAARVVKEHLLAKHQFWTRYGVRTLSADERMYDPADSRGNPSNWLGPIWIVSNYIAWASLRRYGFVREARELAGNLLALMAADQVKNGHWHENYNPETGAGIAAPGFVSWNLLIHFMLEDQGP